MVRASFADRELDDDSGIERFNRSITKICGGLERQPTASPDGIDPGGNERSQPPVRVRPSPAHRAPRPPSIQMLEMDLDVLRRTPD